MLKIKTILQYIKNYFLNLYDKAYCLFKGHDWSETYKKEWITADKVDKSRYCKRCGKFEEL